MHLIFLPQCKWCSSVKMCSDGMDRNRQEWLKNRCEQASIDDTRDCSSAAETTYVTDDVDDHRYSIERRRNEALLDDGTPRKELQFSGG